MSFFANPIQKTTPKGDSKIMSSPFFPPFLALITPLTGNAPGGNPPGIWGGSNEGFPTHPIAPGGRPPGIWGGSNEGFPTHPIAPGGPPPHVAHPIPPIVWPEPPPGSRPPGGGDTGTPEHPINLPPTALGDTGFWHEAYAAAAGGWVWVWVPYPQPESPGR